jgi:hypothetical protein
MGENVRPRHCNNCMSDDPVACMEAVLTPGYYSDEFWYAAGCPDTCHCKCHVVKEKQP